MRSATLPPVADPTPSLEALLVRGPVAWGSPTPATPWSVDRWGRLLAGVGTLLCLALAQLVSPWFLLGIAATALNLVVTSFTDACALRNTLIRLGAREREELFAPGGAVRGEQAVRLN